MIFKSFVLASFLFTSSVSLADELDLSGLAMATSEATEVTAALYGEENILSYKVEKADDEALVEVMVDSFGEFFAVTLGCHAHDDHVDCHEEDERALTQQSELLKTSASFLRLGETEAMRYVPARLKERVTGYQVWALSEGDEQEVWTRFDVAVRPGEVQSFYVACHDVNHGGQTSFHCHVTNTAPIQPSWD